MGKFAIALLVIVLELFVISSSPAEEQVRHLQEELRKRHLFYGNPDGEFSPALVNALSRYQTKKGFPVTGVLDSETCASLGITCFGPHVAPTPFVVAKAGDVRGMNGELLPSSTPLFAFPSSRTWPPPAMLAQEASKPGPPDTRPRDIRPPSEGRSQKVQAGRGQRRADKATTNPFVIAYKSVDRAVKLIVHDTQPRKKRDRKKRG
jgi:peptidoglycan hydrolase-like protein with peptidoglycan-binding domain